MAVNKWDALGGTGREVWISYLELLGLSSHAHWVHHGDEDGNVPQRAPHTSCYTDTQRVTGTFSELHRAGILMLWSWKHA